MAHRAKRWLYLTHRWLGIATCLLMAMWFLSGMVMMYVPFPSLTDAERLDGLTPIDWQAMERMPDRAWPVQSMVLEQLLTEPVWRIEQAGGSAKTVSAASGRDVSGVDAEHALLIAEAFARAPSTSIEPVDRDQWTVAGGYDHYRPLWKVGLLGPEGRVLYIASTDGRVVLDTSRHERFWNWLGSVPHWLYPTVLRQDQPLWRQVVLWTSGMCIVGVIAGMWIGILRVRLRRRYKGGRTTPYRGCTSWIVSGWLSVDPWRWFESPGLSDPAFAAYARPQPLPKVAWQRVAALPEAKGARRVRAVWIDGKPLLVFERANSPPAVRDMRTLESAQFDSARLVRAARRLLPGVSIVRTDLITETDAYWYQAKGQVELPVLRVKFSDSAKTWVYISPRTGEIVGLSDSRRRLYRWFYDGLHRWDFGFLINHRPFWDLWMWAWLIPGLVVAVSGVVIGVRRLSR